MSSFSIFIDFLWFFVIILIHNKNKKAMKKVFIFKPLTLMVEGEKGFVPSAAVIILYKDEKYWYCINLRASYSPKQDIYNPIHVVKLDGKYFIEDLTSSNITFYPQTKLPKGLELTELVEIQPVFYRSLEYVESASFELLNAQFDEMIDDPELMAKDQEYFKLLVSGLLVEEKIVSYYNKLSLLDIILVYYGIQSNIEQIDQEVKDPWTIDEKKIYKSWVRVLDVQINSRITSEWKTLSKGRQEEFFERFQASQAFEWVAKIPKAN